LGSIIHGAEVEHQSPCPICILNGEGAAIPNHRVKSGLMQTACAALRWKGYIDASIKHAGWRCRNKPPVAYSDVLVVEPELPDTT
jgi:hypothetical protein